MTLSVALKKSKLNQTELAKKVDCAPQTICRILSGKRQPSYQLASRIASALRMSVAIVNGRLQFKKGAA